MTLSARHRALHRFEQDPAQRLTSPILDRAVTYESNIYDALKIGLISMDSTIRSNLSVGPPIDIILLRRDALRLDVSTRIEANDPYFRDLRDRWSKALRDAHMGIPAPPDNDRNPETP